MCNATAVTALVTENTGKTVSASTCLPVVISARPPQTSTTCLPSTWATTCRPISPRLLMAASTASWTMLFGFVAIVLPPAPSWSRRYVPAYTTFLLKKRHPCLILLHLRQRLLRLREQACAVHGRRDVSRHGDDGLDQINLRPSPLCFLECSIQVHESRHWPRRGAAAGKPGRDRRRLQ